MRPVAIDDFCRLKFISEPSFSPSGKTACFVVSEASKEKNCYLSRIYVKKGSRISPLTSGGKECSFRYLDENTLLFPGNREEEKDSIASHFYRISLKGGEAEPALSLPIPVSLLLPLKNGDYLALGTTFPGYEELYTGDKKLLQAYLQDRRDNADYEVITQNPWWVNGGTFLRGSYSSLFYVDARKNKLSRLTGLNTNIFNVQLSPDGSAVYFMSAPIGPRRLDVGVYALNRMELSTRELTVAAVSRPDFEIVNYALGESFAVILAADQKHGRRSDTDFHRLDYLTGEVSLLCRHGEAVGNTVGSDSRHGAGRVLKMVGDTLWFISTRFDSSYLFKLENGEITRVTQKEGSVDCFDVCGEQLLLCAMHDMKLPELYDGSGKQLTHLNDAYEKAHYIAEPKPLNIPVGDHDIHGFVLEPLGVEDGKKHPVIIDIHGGPKTVFGPVFHHEMQYWAGMGYYVIFCNPTGSDGRNAFSDIRGKYGTVDYEDLMAFCDAALEAYPQMDKENFFETGGSYGGFMTNWIVGHTDRFKACVTQRSIANWFSFWGIADVGVPFSEDQQQANPWNDPEKFWEHSPMKYADRIKTPTLVLHSLEDYRCPVDQAYQMFTSLVANGVEAKLVLFRGENHELSRNGKPLHRIRRLKEITGWFESHRS